MLAQEERDWVIARTSHTTKTKRASLYFAIMACSADGEYHEGERKAIRKLAQAIDISEDELKQLEAMCVEEQKLREKRVKLLFPDGPPMAT